MPQKSSIEWTDYTSNPFKWIDLRTNKVVWFCIHASPGCVNCYAEALNRRWGGVKTLGVKGLEFKAQNAQHVKPFVDEKELEAILSLSRRLAKVGETGRIFCFDMTDWCLDLITDEMRDKFFAVAALCPNLTFQLLTKHPDKMERYMTGPYHAVSRVHAHIIALTAGNVPADAISEWPLPNVWLGTSVESQPMADKRIPALLRTPAAVHWLSVEPLLEAVDLRGKDAQGSCLDAYEDDPKVDWVVVGGESGTGARHTNLAWIRSVIVQCETAKVPVFVKQVGSWAYRDDPDDAKAKWRLETKSGKGGDPSEWPEDLRKRQMPEVAT